MKRFIVLIAAITAAGCVDTLVGPDPTTTPAGLFDIVWADFDRNYAAFGLKQLDWDDVRRRYAPQAAAAPSVDALAPIIGAMFRELHDPHVDLLLPNRKYYSSVDLGAVKTYFSPPAILGNYVPGSVMTPSRNIRYGKLASDVGWIWIGSFGGDGWASEIDDVLKALGNVSAVIIDVRNNGGGSTNNSEPIAARFFDEERVFSYFQYRNGPGHDDFTEVRSRTITPAGTHFGGRVVVLTNRRCVSATEGFVLAMKVQPGVQLVGDTTAGGFGNPLTRELPNGWVYRLPQWIQYDANHRVLEDVGIAPDVVVRITAADSVAGKDPQLEKALAMARGQGVPASLRKLLLVPARNRSGHID